MHTREDDESSAFVLPVGQHLHSYLFLLGLVCDHGLLFWLFLPEAEEESRLDALGPQEKKEKEGKERQKQVSGRKIASVPKRARAVQVATVAAIAACPCSFSSWARVCPFLARQSWSWRKLRSHRSRVSNHHGTCQRLDQNGLFHTQV